MSKGTAKGNMIDSYMGIAETLKFLPVCFKRNIVPILLGHTGNGKTEVIHQEAEKLGMDCLVIHVAQLEPADFLGYAKIEGNRTVNCQPSWLPDKEKFNPKGGIVFLDEINRGHEDIRQALFQFVTTKRIHTYSLPDNYYIVCAANPFDGYEVYDFDAALRNRFAWVKFRPTIQETMEYLKGIYKNNAVIWWANSQKDVIDYGSEFTVDDQLFTPRFAEKAAQIFEEVKNEPVGFIRKALSTIMCDKNIAAFMSYLEELNSISIEDVLKGKNKAKLQELIDIKRQDVLSTITNNLADYFRKQTQEDIAPKEEEVKNLVEYIKIIPDDLGLAFLDGLSKEYKTKNVVSRHPYFVSELKPKFDYLKKVVAETTNAK